ncbi:hypothetical protein E4U39_003405 [Claviceps sp. Clav50 group G5]|nr:hypothetical protein E4U39_003405 [Claviceps sp. Clav50 group G5]
MAGNPMSLEESGIGSQDSGATLISRLKVPQNYLNSRRLPCLIEIAKPTALLLQMPKDYY